MPARITMAARPRIGRHLAAALAVLVLTACSGPAPSTPDPAQVLRATGRALAGLRTLSADISFGPGIVIQGLTLSSASSRIRLPDASDTTFKVRQGDFLVDLRVITLDGHVFLRLPFSTFTELPASEASRVPDVSRLFDPRTGLPAVLARGAHPRYLGTARVGDQDCDQVSAGYAAAQLGGLLGGITPAGEVTATVWAGRRDHLPRRVVLSGPLLGRGGSQRVQADLHGFDQPVAISAPA
ncbi:MAG TPA: LppX_LprAFG lipoprotein [Candidatus Dormibacteraeota bacterium]|nr:LppX_LprAFG lipoprotein [Candidatus Dormibacteraeota bacterium]